MNEKKQIEELENKIVSLEESLKRLAILVEPNEKYPYWHKLLCLGINEGQKRDLEYIMSFLTSRLNREEEFLNYKGDGTNRFPSDLYSDEIPTAHNAIAIISKTLQIKHEEIIKEILLSMFKQGMFTQIITFLFPSETKSIQD